MADRTVQEAPAGQSADTNVANQVIEEEDMDENIRNILTTSNDPNELYRIAISLVKSNNPAGHALLMENLSREVFLGRLDSEKDYLNGPRFLRISRIIKALKETQVQTARQILVGLTQAKDFTSNWTRADLLIEALIDFRPPPEPVIRFWDQHCQPEDGFMNLTVQCLARNGSEQAIALLEKKLANPGFEEEEKVWWLHTAILTHRNDLLVLQASERLLSGGLPESLRSDLVETLFDYQPEEWHGPDDGYPPPPLEQASPEARNLLLKLGEYALGSVDLTEAQKKNVEARMEAVKKLQ